MQIFLENKYQIFLASHPKFKEKNLLRVRLDLSREILDLEMPEDQRAYLLHRLAHAHTTEEVTELITRVKAV